MTKNDLIFSKKECTVLKGIAILTVILSHTCGVCRLFDGIPLLGNDLICSAICKAGMPLFLFISGYGLHASYIENGLKDYWKKKLISVLLPYFIIQAIAMIIHTARYGNDRSILYNISVLTGINADNSYDPTMWYISYILFWYLIFFISYIIGKGELISVLIIGLVSLAGFLYVPFYWGKNADYCIMTFFAGILTAWLGCAKKDTVSNSGTHNNNANFAGFLVILPAVAGYTILITFSRFSLISENLGSLMAMSAFIMLVKLIHRKYSFPVLSFIGDISFPLYLLEWKLIINNFIYDRFGIGFFTYVICFVLTVGLSVLLNRLFKKMTEFFKGFQIRDQKTR